MKRALVFKVALCLVVSSMALRGQSADALVLQGRNQLSQTNYGAASASFAAALTLQPGHQEAHVLQALSRLALVPLDPPGRDLLTRLGFPLEGRNLWNWQARLPSDTNGVPLVTNQVNAAELVAFLRATALPAVQASAADLTAVTNETFLLSCSQAESQLSDFLVDYGDVQVLRAALATAEYLIFLLDSQEWSVQLEALRALYDAGLFSLERVFADHPALLTFAKADDLLRARDAITAAVDSYVAGSDRIRQRAGQEPPRLFNLEWRDLPGEADLRCTLVGLRDSLSRPVVLCSDTNLTVVLREQLAGGWNVRSWLPRFAGNRILAATLPDPTLGGVLLGLSVPGIDSWLAERVGVASWFVDWMAAASADHILTFNTVTGHWYAVEYSTNLNDWAELAAFQSTSSTYAFTNTVVSSGISFYRLHDLAAYAAYEGRVTDQCSGRPIMGATVTTSPGGHHATTDAAGRFLLQTRSLQRSDPFAVTVSAEGFAARELPWSTSWMYSPLHLALAPIVPPVAANDLFANRAALSGLPAQGAGNTCGASRESGEPSHWPSDLGLKSIWWSWTAPASGNMVVWPTHDFVPSYRELIAVYTGGTVGTLGRLSYGDGSRGARFAAVAGQTYQIAVAVSEQTPDGGGTLAIHIEQYETSPRLIVSSPKSGARFAAPADLVLEAELSGAPSLAEGYYSLWGDAVSTGGLLTKPVASIALPELAAGDYYLDVNMSMPGVASYNSNVTFRVHAPNDDYARRSVISSDQENVLGTTRGAGGEATEPGHAGFEPIRSVWWSWTAPAAGSFTISAVGTEKGESTTNVLAVYTGAALAALLPVAGSVSIGDPGVCQVSLPAVVGTAYSIVLDTHAYRGSDYALKLTRGTPPNALVTSPANGTQTTSESLRIEATAADNDGTIARVEFYADGVLLGSLVQPPYTYSWSGLPYGLAQCWVVAVDDTGLRGYSTKVEIRRVPANDHLVNASLLVGTNLTVNGSNVGATLEPGERLWNDLGYQGGASVWWRWTPPFEGLATVSAGFAARYRGVLGAFTGTAIANVAPVARAVSWTGSAQLSFLAAPGTPYLIALDGAYAQQGTLELTLDLQRVVPLAEALDTTALTWRTSGAVPWSGQVQITKDGVDAATSGTIQHNADSVLETDVIGPGTLSFWWKVSSQTGSDFLQLHVDGALQPGRISGESGWEPRSVVIPAGSHTLTWRYRKDANGSAGQDRAWVDEVTYVAVPIPPAITVQPVSQAGLPGENVSFSVAATGSLPLSYQWHRDGVGLVEGGRLSGVTTPNLTIAGIASEDVGAYSVLVSNEHGTVASDVVALSLRASLDSSFNPRANGWVAGLAWLDDGGIVLGGRFDRLNAQVRQSVARLNPDGTLNNTFTPVVGPTVYSLAVQTDGKVLVAGQYTTRLDGQLRANLTRFRSDGSFDTDFDPGVSGSIASVSSLAIQEDGRILVAGFFSTVGGTPRENLARLESDGSVDNAFNPGASGFVSSLAVQTDGRVVVGGSFSALGGAPRRFIGRLNPDGTLDDTFDPSADDRIDALALQPDGKILVGGDFTLLRGRRRPGLARLNADGTLDEDFNPTAGSWVSSLALQADGRIVVGGNFTALGGKPRSYIARLNGDGTLDEAFDPGTDNAVSALALQPDGRLLLGGNFTRIAGQSRLFVGRLNNTGPARETLGYQGTTLTWLRSGTGPEVWRTTFESSDDGASWKSLGSGVRIPGGWQISQVSLDRDAYIRARGFTTGGLHNGSCWFIERRSQVSSLARVVGVPR